MFHNVKIDVASAYEKSAEGLDRLDIKNKEVHLARQTGRDRKHVQDVRMIKRRDGNVLASARNEMAG